MKLRIPFRKRTPSVAVLHLHGAIGMGARGLNAQAYEPVIEKAFKKGKPTAVALSINSPGGSPVQSSLIAGQIRRLADETETPVYAFVEDLAASGGYWLATAADEIWADASSVLGSIGVISSGFGLDRFIERHSIDRRVHTAGKSKSMMDPFRPEKAEDIERLSALLEDIHSEFKSQVTTRRGDKLTSEQDLFTGEVWLARRAIELGLADGIGHLKPKMREVFGDETQFRKFGVKRSPWSRFGARAIDDALSAVEERAAFAQFGL